MDTSTAPEFFEYYAQQSASGYMRAHFSRLVDMISQAVPSTGEKALEVLDIGGGAGTLSRILAERGYRPTCIDISADLIEEGRRRAEKEGLEIAFFNGSATDLPMADASFDICLMPELLEHVEDWQACLSQAARVLKPGGALYLSTTNTLCPRQQEFDLPLYSWYPPALKRYWVKRALSDRPEIVNHARFPAVNWFTVASLKAFLTKEGFDRFYDRSDLLAVKHRTGAKAIMAQALTKLPPMRYALQWVTPASILLAFKGNSSVKDHPTS